MLIAPKSGARLRGDVQDFARENLHREKLDSLMQAGRQRIQPLVKETRERVAAALDTAQAGANLRSSRFMEIINEWPHNRLIAIDGIGPVLASRIIQGRPYKSEDELTQSKTLPPSALDSLRKAA